MPTYALERELGRGGMATVFLAQDLKHKRPVALKVLHPELAYALGPERFRREVELAARLQHPHILTVFDSGEAAGHLWFTMPYVEGESLRDRLSRERQLPVEDSVRIALEAARALEYAHQHGVIHRDIKPENILLTADGSTLVADFGIARALAVGGEEGSLTETGMAVGTPAYMSPEQAAGERALDPRTDVYALGCVLYEMLAGEPPFSGPTAQAIIARRLRGEVPDVRASRPAVARALAEVVSKALAPVAADRFSSAAELARALTGAVTASLTAPRPSPETPAPGIAAGPKRGVPAGFALLLVGFLVGVGVLFAWRRGGHVAGGAGPKVIAVLPFENQGDSTQAYFADGITDEVRGKLTALPGVQVIAGGSSEEYRGSAKPLEKIGDELGADYLLVAKVRWARGAGGALQVRVSPELVALQGGRPTSQWQQTFDAALTDVFQVQADIAGQVAEALNLALTDSVRQELAAKPTANLPAYDAFLRAEEISTADYSAAGQRRALAYYRQAIALDSTFAPAWAQLSRTLSFLHGISPPERELAVEARAAADRAMALNSALVQTHLAQVGYAANVLRDNDRAQEAVRAGLAVLPNDPQLIAKMGNLLGAAGQWDSALVYSQRAARLDPRSAFVARILGTAFLFLRRHPEALREARRARMLHPADLTAFHMEVMTLLAMGDLAGAHAAMRMPPQGAEPAAVVAYFAAWDDLYWVLDDPQQQLLLTLGPSQFDDDRGDWGLALAETWWLRGDRARAQAYADSAATAFEQQLRERPDLQRRGLLALCQAYAGRRAEAIRLGEAAAADAPLTSTGEERAYVRELLARIYVLTGEPDKAVDRLTELLTIPYYVSPGWLRIDPMFAPLKGNPRFERLIAAS